MTSASATGRGGDDLCKQRSVILRFGNENEIGEWDWLNGNEIRDLGFVVRGQGCEAGSLVLFYSAKLYTAVTLKRVTWLIATSIHGLKFSVRTKNNFLTSVLIGFEKSLALP